MTIMTHNGGGVDDDEDFDGDQGDDDDSSMVEVAGVADVVETDGDQRNHCNLPSRTQVNSPHDDDDYDDGNDYHRIFRL